MQDRKEEQSPVSDDGLSECGKGSSPRADVAITEEEKTLIYQRLNYAQNIRRWAMKFFATLYSTLGFKCGEETLPWQFTHYSDNVKKFLYINVFPVHVFAFRSLPMYISICFWLSWFSVNKWKRLLLDPYSKICGPWSLEMPSGRGR